MGNVTLPHKIILMRSTETHQFFPHGTSPRDWRSYLQAPPMHLRRSRSGTRRPHPTKPHICASAPPSHCRNYAQYFQYEKNVESKTKPIVLVCYRMPNYSPSHDLGQCGCVVIHGVCAGHPAASRGGRGRIHHNHPPGGTRLALSRSGGKWRGRQLRR